MSKLFKFFSGTENKSGRGITKQQVERDKKMGSGYFFRLLKSRLGNISSTNLIFTLCNFPVILFLIGISGTFDDAVSAPSTPMFAQLYGMITAGESNPVITTLLGMFGSDSTMSIATDLSKVLMSFSLLLIVTFGLSTVGFVYNFRCIARGEPLSPWSEFFPVIKKNWKQALPISILDALMIVFIVYDLMAYHMGAGTTGSMLSLTSFYIVLFFGLIYYVMRFHIYLIMITFDIKFSKMIKNALFLVFLGWKRSLACIFSSIAIVFVSFMIYWMLPHFGILLPFVITVGLLGFIGVYCTYPVIDEYMIKPYYEDHPEELPQEEEVEPIFTDRG